MIGRNSARVRASWLFGALLTVSLPAFAAGDPDFCAQLARLGDATRDSRVHQVRIVWTAAADAPSCKATGAAERSVCAWLARHRAESFMITLSQQALACLGHDPLPPDDPGVFVTNAWWSRGSFGAVSGPLMRADLDYTMDLNLDGETGPWWILLTARPK